MTVGKTEPKNLNPEWVGARVAVCGGCGEQRWYGYGACRTCGEYLDDEPSPPALTEAGDDGIIPAARDYLRAMWRERGEDWDAQPAWRRTEQELTLYQHARSELADITTEGITP